MTVERSVDEIFMH